MWKQFADGGHERPKPRRRRGKKKSYNDDIGSYFEDPNETVKDENRPKTAAELSRDMVAQGTTHQSYTIGGVKIQFPAKPYPSQFSMMDKIVKGLDKSQNSLLESPTGSGKSLALLCSALAWQRAQKEKIKKEESQQQDDCCCRCHRSNFAEAAENVSSAPNNLDETVIAPVMPEDRGALVSDPVKSLDETMAEEDDDFKMPKKKFRNPEPSGGRPHIVVEYDHGFADISEDNATPGMATFGEAAEGPCNCQCRAKSSKRVPKIYFGTRTHKQVAQIVREFAKTAYRDTRMTILASREHTCIDPEVSNMPKKTEECKNKREGPGCPFFNNVKKVTHVNLEVNGLDLAWDLEDFVKWNKRHRACPYYGSRQLRETADIIFCPYNYLVDPIIRDTMEINLKDQIVILDEAHNIEDSARESASFSATQMEMADSMKDLEKMISFNKKAAEHSALRNMLMSLNDIINTFKDSLASDTYDQASRVWSGMEIVAQLQNAKLGAEQVHALVKCFQAACEDDQNEKLAIKLPAACLSLFEGFFMVLKYIYMAEMKYMTDYRVAIVRTMTYTSTSTDGTWVSKKRRSYQPTFQFALHFWCMNPAVAFSDLHDVKSIVLTSGTLSPMSSFQSELGQPFPIQLEASHVINNKQVWVGSISKGPRGGNLLGSYQHTETFQYQDELGQLVLEVCKTVPHGVLCFLTSYKMIEKLINRWLTTGLYQELRKCKEIFREPRGADKDIDFDELLRNFYSVIKDTDNTDRPDGEVTGALFLAVVRGKVSEGMDFTDNNARAVITVGIPYPNVMDTQIGLKRKYNNEHSGQRGLLTGSDWYEIQAYRALNQALGRCIRHRYDWGALILVDERYGKNPAKYTKGLSKWVRQKVQFFGNFFQAQRSLKEFTEQMIASPPCKNVDISLSVSQMNLSVAVETHPNTQVDQKPRSSTTPSPPVLPPATAVETSPPLDTEQSYTQPSLTGNPLLQSSTVKASTPYVLDSQAGGFIISQNSTQYPTQLQSFTRQTQGHLDENLPSQINGTFMGNQTIISGPTCTQQVTLNDSVDFKPPMTSTQACPRQSLFAPASTSTQKASCPPSGNLTFAPSLTSTQVNGFVGMNGVKPPSLLATNGQNVSTMSKPILNKMRGEKHDPDPGRIQRQGNETKRDSSIHIVSDEDDDLNIDERSNSPELFDAEECLIEDDKCVIGATAELKLDDKVPEPSKARSGRLSRRKSTDQNRSILNDSAVTPLTTASTKTLSGPGKKVPKGVVFEDSDENPGLIPEDSGRGDTFKTTEGLNKRRSTRSKRRKLSSIENSYTSGDDMLDDLEDTKDILVTCKECCKNLTSFAQGFREVQLPGYIISALPSAYHGGRALTGDANCMDMNKCKLVAASSESGLQLNCVWNEDKQCCLQFYSCSNKCKNDSNIVAVKGTSFSDRKEQKYKNQIWFLTKHCNTTAR